MLAYTWIEDFQAAWKGETERPLSFQLVYQLRAMLLLTAPPGGPKGRHKTPLILPSLLWEESLISPVV